MPCFYFVNQQVLRAKRDQRVHLENMERKAKQENKAKVAVLDHQVKSDRKTLTGHSQIDLTTSDLQVFPKYRLFY